MTITSEPTESAIPSTSSDAIVIGPIHLDVTDRERGLAFWRDLIGLELISDSGAQVDLGVGGKALIVLHPGATKPLDRNRSGLYHLALHLPSLSEFARVAARVHQAGLHQYPVDHLMHLADYVDDFDGIGLELVFETRERYGSLEVTGSGMVMRDADGQPHSGREPLDLRELVGRAPESLEGALPAGTFLGHIHLRVADLDETLVFYRDQIGLTTNMHIPGFAMFDMSAGGTFPHRLAGNVWESKGQPVKDPDTAGLRSFTLAYRASADLDKAATRLEQAGQAIETSNGRLTVLDPSGISLDLTTVSAEAS